MSINNLLLDFLFVLNYNCTFQIRTGILIRARNEVLNTVKPIKFGQKIDTKLSQTDLSL